LERSDIKFRLIPKEEKAGRKTTKESKVCFIYCRFCGVNGG